MAARAYSRRHGYAFYDDVPPLSGRPACWSKLTVLAKALERHEWVFWVDADAVAQPGATALEPLIPASGDLVCEDPATFLAWLGLDPATGRKLQPVHTAVFGLRRSVWSQNLIAAAWARDEWISTAEPWNGVGEQEAINAVLKRAPALTLRLRYVTGLQAPPALIGPETRFVHFYADRAQARWPRGACEAVLAHYADMIAAQGSAAVAMPPLMLVHWCAIQLSGAADLTDRGGAGTVRLFSRGARCRDAGVRGGRQGGPCMITVVECSAGQAAAADIILLHGIDGDPVTSWAQVGERPVFADRLAARFPDACVRSLGYPAALATFRATPGLDLAGVAGHVAATFTTLLTAQRPLVIVGFCLGGMVAAMALRQLEQAGPLPRTLLFLLDVPLLPAVGEDPFPQVSIALGLTPAAMQSSTDWLRSSIVDGSISAVSILTEEPGWMEPYGRDALSPPASMYRVPGDHLGMVRVNHMEELCTLRHVTAEAAAFLAPQLDTRKSLSRRGR
jgi:hypothetical protein